MVEDGIPEFQYHHPFMQLKGEHCLLDIKCHPLNQKNLSQEHKIGQQAIVYACVFPRNSLGSLTNIWIVIMCVETNKYQSTYYDHDQVHQLKVPPTRSLSGEQRFSLLPNTTISTSIKNHNHLPSSSRKSYIIYSALLTERRPITLAGSETEGQKENNVMY